MGFGKRLRYLLRYALFRLVLALTRFAPLPLLRALFGRLGTLLAPLARKDYQRAQHHLQKALGREANCQVLLRAHAQHLGMLVGEALWLAHAPASAILRWTRFVGLDHLRTALAQGRGVVLVTGHCGNWEWMNLALQAAGIPMTAAGRGLRDPRFDAFITYLRTRFGGQVAVRGRTAGRELLKALQQGRVAGLLIDQDVKVPGVFVPFFGEPAWTPIGAALLSLRRQCPVVVGFACRTADGFMEITLQEPFTPEGDPNREEDLARLTALLTARIEAHIRQHPEQWVWFHQRWRRRPQPQDRVWSLSG
ncbi:MAG: lysophospholipid acyltransferase family protein [Thermoanaerobaculum sp.]|nr:lysophospholipid acyltransferase family protein [Thermoanaerobaculum sp.]